MFPRSLASFDSLASFPNLNAPVDISKAMLAAKVCFSKILQFKLECRLTPGDLYNDCNMVLLLSLFSFGE